MAPSARRPLGCLLRLWLAVLASSAAFRLLEEIQVVREAPEQGVLEKPKMAKVTLINDYHRPLLQEGLGDLLHDELFLSGLQVHCADDASMRWCADAVKLPGRCLRTEGTMARSDFQKSDYYKLIWAKWHIIHRALQEGADGVLWLDADVAVFSDLSGGLASEGDVDFMYQSEVVDSKGAPSGMNGGQLWLRRSNATFAFLAEMFKHDKDQLKLDQDWAQSLAPTIPGLRHQPLPLSFHSKCWQIGVTAGTRTFHANCLTGEASKRAAMRQARRQRAEADARA